MKKVVSAVPPPPGAGQPLENELRDLLLRLLRLVAAEVARRLQLDDPAGRPQSSQPEGLPSNTTAQAAAPGDVQEGLP
jgi:hypothetical protein